MPSPGLDYRYGKEEERGGRGGKRRIEEIEGDI
jgi:hypothetical protein